MLYPAPAFEEAGDEFKKYFSLNFQETKANPAGQIGAGERSCSSHVTEDSPQIRETKFPGMISDVLWWCSRPSHFTISRPFYLNFNLISLLHIESNRVNLDTKLCWAFYKFIIKTLFPNIFCSDSLSDLKSLSLPPVTCTLQGSKPSPPKNSLEK